MVFLTACSSKENLNTTNSYFDIRGFFEKEAIRLQKQGPLIEKKAVHSSQPETKKIKLTDWKTELELFRESDINKPAWRDSYRAIKNGTDIDYVAVDSSLRTRKISIRFSNSGNPTHIFILNKTTNLLYSTHEELNYHPDSLYSIRKNQDIRVLGASTYSVEGRFKTKIK